MELLCHEIVRQESGRIHHSASSSSGSKTEAEADGLG